MEDKERQEYFLKLFEPVRENLVRYARAMTRNPENAKDLVSETILAAYQNFHKLKRYIVI
jgi:DNA-directed RNA polymerase specialized sigma24 family protein